MVAALGLFALFFCVGLYGLPQRHEKPEPASRAPVVAAASPSSADQGHVMVKELAPQADDEKPVETKRRDRRKRERRSPKTEASSPSSDASSAETSAETSSPPPDEAPPAIQDSSGSSVSPDNSNPSEARPAETHPAPAPPQDFRVQAGVFKDADNAQKMADRLASAGYPPSVSTSKTNEGTVYRVQAGPFQGRKAAEDAVRDLGQQGISTRVSDE
jgi:cell division septation protein DedD